MIIDLSTVAGISDSYGNIVEIKDSAGRVIWSSTVTFVMNGETYQADRGMTWAEWFASAYNTTGETEGDIKDANGNAVSLDAVIVGGAAYEVGFDDGMRTITCIECDTSYAEIQYNIGNDNYSISDVGEFVIPIGTIFSCWVQDENGWTSGGFAGVVVNGTKVYETLSEGSYEYTVTKNATIRIVNNVERGVIYITEE